MAVEKLALNEFAEIASRQQALQTIFPSALDIFYLRFLTFLRKTDFFNSHSSYYHITQNATLRSDQNHSFPNFETETESFFYDLQIDPA